MTARMGTSCPPGRLRNRRTSKTLARSILLLALAAQTAFAQSPTISVKNTVDRKGHRVEIVVLDPSASSREVEGELPMPVTPAVPDGGQIVGTMISGRGSFAITATKILGIGEHLNGYRIVAISAGHVTMASGARTHELDVMSGEWTAESKAGVAE